MSQERGPLLVAPQDRLSMRLKQQELQAKGQAGLCAALENMASIKIIDLLDESDELLHHRSGLVQ